MGWLVEVIWLMCIVVGASREGSPLMDTPTSISLEDKWRAMVAAARKQQEKNHDNQ